MLFLIEIIDDEGEIFADAEFSTLEECRHWAAQWDKDALDPECSFLVSHDDEVSSYSLSWQRLD